MIDTKSLVSTTYEMGIWNQIRRYQKQREKYFHKGQTSTFHGEQVKGQIERRSSKQSMHLHSTKNHGKQHHKGGFGQTASIKLQQPEWEENHSRNWAHIFVETLQMWQWMSTKEGSLSTRDIHATTLEWMVGGLIYFDLQMMIQLIQVRN